GVVDLLLDQGRIGVVDVDAEARGQACAQEHDRRPLVASCGRRAGLGAEGRPGLRRGGGSRRGARGGHGRGEQEEETVLGYHAVGDQQELLWSPSYVASRSRNPIVPGGASSPS